jgi:hypothetical protein
MNENAFTTGRSGASFVSNEQATHLAGIDISKYLHNQQQPDRRTLHGETSIMKS